MAIHYDLVKAEEIEAAFQIEAASKSASVPLSISSLTQNNYAGYPADEAASLEAFQYGCLIAPAPAKI